MSLRVATAGQGPTLVLLHGWGLNSRVWDSVLPRLNQRFTTVCIDLPGHGGSSWPPAFHDIDSLADAIEPYLRRPVSRPAEQQTENPRASGSNPCLAAESPCFLLGWSLGSMTALALAARHPALIRRLILVAATPTFLRSPDWPNGVDGKALQDMADRVLTDFQETVRDFLMWQVYGDEHARPALKMLRDKVQAGGEPSPEALKAGLETLQTIDLRSRLPAIDIPALVISGERDRLSHPLAGQALATALPQGQFLQIARAAHAPFLSHEAEFCAAIEQFLVDAP